MSEKSITHPVDCMCHYCLDGIKQLASVGIPAEPVNPTIADLQAKLAQAEKERDEANALAKETWKVTCQLRAELASLRAEAGKILDAYDIATGNEHAKYSLLERVDILGRSKNYFVRETDKGRAELARLREALDAKAAAMVEAFLAWPLPASVCSDACATMRDYPNRTGTNLLTADEAKQMFEWVLAQAALNPKGKAE